MRDALIAVAELLAPGNPDVVAKVTAAYDDPGGYVRENAARLDDRGIDEPIPNLAWIALVNALTDAGLVAEVDWKELPDDVIAQLRRLRSAPSRPDAWDWFEVTDIDIRTEEFLRVAGDRLRAVGTTLASLDIDSDCYPLVLLPAERTADAVRLAALAGYRVDVPATAV